MKKSVRCWSHVLFVATTQGGYSLSALYYNFSKLFGLRARDEARQLKLEDVTLKETNGNKHLEFQERCTKTRDGSNVHDVRGTTPKIFPSADGLDNR